MDGLIALMESNYSLPVNLGNPDEYTIKEFAVCAYCGLREKRQVSLYMRAAHTLSFFLFLFAQVMIQGMVDKNTEIRHLPATQVKHV